MRAQLFVSRSGVVAVVFAVVAACGGGTEPGKTPSGGRASCATDDECVISTSTGCCKACPDQPFGMPALAAEQQQNKCKTVDCAASSDRIECPKTDPKDMYVAVCKDGTCAAKKK